jgi:hypothetical protein
MACKEGSQRHDGQTERASAPQGLSTQQVMAADAEYHPCAGVGEGGSGLAVPSFLAHSCPRAGRCSPVVSLAGCGVTARRDRRAMARRLEACGTYGLTGVTP